VQRARTKKRETSSNRGTFVLHATSSHASPNRRRQATSPTDGDDRSNAHASHADSLRSNVWCSNDEHNGALHAAVNKKALGEHPSREM